MIVVVTMATSSASTASSPGLESSLAACCSLGAFPSTIAFSVASMSRSFFLTFRSLLFRKAMTPDELSAHKQR